MDIDWTWNSGYTYTLHSDVYITIVFEYTTEQPIYIQIANALKMKIAAGSYSLGEKLPSIRKMSQETNINTATMQRAFHELEQQGYITHQRRNGVKCVTVGRSIKTAYYIFQYQNTCYGK